MSETIPVCYAPSTRCWACGDSGWVVSRPSDHSTLWTTCECRIIRIEPIPCSTITTVGIRAA